MSHSQSREHTKEPTAQETRQARRTKQEQDALKSNPTQEPTMSQSSNGADHADPAGNTVAVHFDKADLTVNLPRKFKAGMPLTASQATILDAAYVRQFTNNLNANAKARADRLAKATAEGDQEGIEDNQPYTADEIASLYAQYEPNVGGGPSLSRIEKMRRDAGWNAWVQLLADHNAAIDAGDTPILNTPNKQSLIAMPRKTKGVSDDQHAANVQKYLETKEAFIDRMLALSKYADRVQVELDKLQAQRGTVKTEAEAPPAATVDVLS